MQGAPNDDQADAAFGDMLVPSVSMAAGAKDDMLSVASLPKHIGPSSPVCQPNTFLAWLYRSHDPPSPSC